MRAAGCVMNDIADRDFDPHVERTRSRPLASGELRLGQAAGAFLVLMVLAFLLVLLTNALTIKLAFVGAVLAASYPFFKRVTHLPQVVLGIAFGWGIPMAFAAEMGAVPLVAWWLLGINTLIYTGTSQASRGDNTGIGISLAIPINLAAFVMRDLIDYGEVIRGWLGVSVDPVLSAVEGTTGQALLVVAVAQGSPAARAGIQVGDVITHIDGEEVTDGRLTMHRIAQLRPGDTIAVSLQRNQQSLELRAVVGIQGQSNPAG